MDSQTEHANHNVGQIFCTIIRNNQKDWADRVDLTEFTINSSISGTTKYTPFELNSRYMPSMIHEIQSDDIIPKGIREFARQALQNLADAHNAIIKAWVFQMYHTNNRRTKEPQLDKGGLVLLSTKNLNVPSGRACKLCPKFIGPYKILEAKHKTSTYTLELPMALQSQHIVPSFNVSLL
jgi:hypothetical protein